MTRHIPVLLKETLEEMHLTKGVKAVDATLGGGGFARALLEAVSPGGTIVAFDADVHALKRFQEDADRFVRQALKDGSLRLVRANYSMLGDTLRPLGGERVAAIVADLGFSSDQIEDAKRGFSFRKDGPLDMRLDQETDLTAERIVNEYPADEIERILRTYGDEPYARRIVSAIVELRDQEPIRTTRTLASLVEQSYPKAMRFRSGIHPATKTFQALRIAVNLEFEHLKRFLEEAIEWLLPGGRLAIITFHSGEDRIVKRFFQEAAQGCICPKGFPVCRCGHTARLRVVTKKPIIPSEEERAVNSRARSARLRIAEKV